jgi:type I restriction enzyme S subunit
MTGSAGQKRVPKKFLQSIQIPLPPLETQKKIVNILDKAQELIDKRKQQIDLMDSLVQSLFYDMFGDPVTNPKKWDIEKLGNTGKLERGKSKHRPRNAPFLLGGKYPLVQTGDISKPGFFINTYNQTYSEAGLAQSKMWPKGTLCITIAANIAKTGILNFDACFPDSVVAFLPSKRINNMYVQFWFGFLQSIIEANAPVSAQKNINLKILNNLNIPVPPITLQNNFAEKVEKIEIQKQKMQKSLKDLEQNFSSLMQRAFKGEI